MELYNSPQLRMTKCQIIYAQPLRSVRFFPALIRHARPPRGPSNPPLRCQLSYLVVRPYWYVAPTYLLCFSLLRRHRGCGGIIPVLELIYLLDHSLPRSFQELTCSPFCKPFFLIFIHVMGVEGGVIVALRHSSQTCQRRTNHAFSLDKNLESLSHPFGMDQRLELQARAHAVRLGLSLLVQVRKFISLPEREQKSRLRG